MRRAACRSKLKSAWVPPSRPTLTMRPLILVALRFWLPTWPETWSNIGATASPPRVGRGTDHHASALEFCDLHRHQADAGACALNQDGLAGLQRAVGDDRVMHGGERDGQ